MSSGDQDVELVSEALIREPRFVAVWRQIRLITDLISDLEERHQRAEESGRQARAMCLQLSLSTMEDVCSMYMEYAEKLGRQVWEKLEEEGAL